MNLPGRLKLTTLGDLLGLLHRDSASGVLELIEQEGTMAGRRHRVYLDAGLIDAVDTTLTSPKLGELLVREGLLTLEGVRTLLRRLLEQPQKKAGQILLDERLLSTALLERALRLQLRTRLDPLFRLGDALVRFHVRRPRGGGAAPEGPLTPREFLHGRPRARARGSSRQAGASTQTQSTEAVRRAAYRELGLEPNADSELVRRAFRRLAALHHPDRHPGASSTEKVALVQKFSRITAAYHRICP
ncbi:MAG TPA: J domain-containing protein [Polyangiaceae bacterium]|jgi:DnaJ-domain-containing protein 1|nr:J domain-containing protein [Polyangiaceae bacterium]